MARVKFTLLLLALVSLVFAPLVVGDSQRWGWITGLSFLGVLVFGVLSTVRQRRILWISLLLGIPAGLAQTSTFVYGADYHPGPRFAIFTAFLFFLAGAIVRDVVKAEAVTWDKIQGALSAYLLVGVAWGYLYAGIAWYDSEAFRGAVPSPAGPPVGEMIYYSFVTLTTLGYGDITPLSQAARTLAWVEAAFGQIYLVVLVARLVSMQLTGRMKSDS